MSDRVPPSDLGRPGGEGRPSDPARSGREGPRGDPGRPGGEGEGLPGDQGRPGEQDRQSDHGGRHDQGGPDERAPTDDPQVLIVVVRTGGIAGIRRRWRIEPPPDETPRWVALIEQCPWDAPDEGQRGADRYIWSIRARTPADRLEREVPDGALAGPWRDLVDAVRDAARK